MTEGNTKEFEMAVGTSTMLETGMIEGESFYTPMESTNETEMASQNNWSGGKPPDTGQLCRSCANTSDYLIPIYEGEGLEHQLEYKIQKHLPIQVSTTDTLPLQLCYQCASTLIAWDTMISSCLEAEKKLKAIQEAAEECKNRELYEDSQIDGGDTEMVDSDDEPLIASKSKLLSEKSKATPLKKKILSKAKSKSVTIKNDKTAANSKEEEDKERWDRARDRANTEKRGNNIDTLKKRKFPKEMESISVLSPDGSLKSIYRCKLCGHKTNRSNNLKAHLQIHKRVLPYRCDGCGRRYQKRQDGKDHLNNIEIVLLESSGTAGTSASGQTRKLYRCKFCGHTSNRSNNLKKHLGSHESAREFNCDHCGGRCRQSEVSSSYHVKEIEVVVVSESDGDANANANGKGKGKRKSFRCRICGETFPRLPSLRGHITTHKPFNIFPCRLCGKEYLGEKSLREHAVNAHGEAVAATMVRYPYKCEYCDQLFAERKTCEEHRETHAGEKPYICHICGCAFRTQSSLYLHSKVHVAGE